MQPKQSQYDKLFGAWQFGPNPCAHREELCRVDHGVRGALADDAHHSWSRRCNTSRFSCSTLEQLLFIPEVDPEGSTGLNVPQLWKQHTGTMQSRYHRSRTLQCAAHSPVRFTQSATVKSGSRSPVVDDNGILLSGAQTIS